MSKLSVYILPRSLAKEGSLNGLDADKNAYFLLLGVDREDRGLLPLGDSGLSYSRWVIHTFSGVEQYPRLIQHTTTLAGTHTSCAFIFLLFCPEASQPLKAPVSV